MRMGTRLCKEWENNFPTQLQFTVTIRFRQVLARLRLSYYFHQVVKQTEQGNAIIVT